MTDAPRAGTSETRDVADRLATAIAGFVGYMHSHYGIGSTLVDAANDAVTELRRVRALPAHETGEREADNIMLKVRALHDGMRYLHESGDLGAVTEYGDLEVLGEALAELVRLNDLIRILRAALRAQGPEPVGERIEVSTDELREALFASGHVTTAERRGQRPVSDYSPTCGLCGKEGADSLGFCLSCGAGFPPPLGKNERRSASQ